MKIRHEAPKQTLDWQVHAPLTIETPTGASVQVVSWSLSGLVWPQDAPDCPKTGTLSVPFQGVDIRFPIRLSAKDDHGFVHLEGLSGRQRETLALFYRSLLSGKMASSGEVITSLDTPVDLVPMEETEAEQSQQSMTYMPRQLRVLINVATYLLIATMVVGIVGSNIFTNLDRIDIQHGRVLAPVMHAFPSHGGFVQSVVAGSGEKVTAGDILIRLRDPELHAQLQQSEAELAVARSELDRVRAGLHELGAVSRSDNVARRIAVAARAYTTFVGTAGGFDDMRRQWMAQRERDAEVATSSDPLVLVTEALRAEEARRSAAVDGLEARRDAYLEMIDNTHIRAPSDGMVRDVFVQPGQLFGAQEMDLSFESAAPRVTVGWVSEKFAETVYIGMPATIGLNEQGETIKLRGAVTDVRAADHPERPGEFGIIVTVTATDLDAEATKHRLRLGAPVNLEAKRQLGQRLRTWLAGLVA